MMPRGTVCLFSSPCFETCCTNHRRCCRSCYHACDSYPSREFLSFPCVPRAWLPVTEGRRSGGRRCSKVVLLVAMCTVDSDGFKGKGAFIQYEQRTNLSALHRPNCRCSGRPNKHTVIFPQRFVLTCSPHVTLPPVRSANIVAPGAIATMYSGQLSQNAAPTHAFRCIMVCFFTRPAVFALRRGHYYSDVHCVSNLRQNNGRIFSRSIIVQCCLRSFIRCDRMKSPNKVVTPRSAKLSTCLGFL